MNAWFEQKQGWVGGDGAYSVVMGNRRIWLFSDTWVGTVRDGKRSGARIVNNSVAVQDRNTSRIQFIVRKNAQGKPEAIFRPADGRGWFWLQAGAYANKKLYIFLMQVEKTGAKGVFGFRQIGRSLGIVANPLDDPLSWRIEQRKLPCTLFSADRIVSYGAAVLFTDGFLYVYGTDEDVRPTGPRRYLTVARVPVSRIGEVSAWRFFDGHGWGPDFRTARRMVGGMASDASVSYLGPMKQYVLVYTDGGLSERILARTAPGPTGPWSQPTVVYRCPEARKDRRIFCYGAKAHPTLAHGNELIISYTANSFDFWQVASDAEIYLPRFVRVNVRQHE